MYIYLLLLASIIKTIQPLFAQNNKNAEYVPCQEMPTIMQNYQADYKTLQRFYTPTEDKYGRVSGNDFSYPEKRLRLKKLSQDYLQSLSFINFDNLSQECKVDYILFKRDLKESIYKIDKEENAFQGIKKWFPMSDSIYATWKLRRRGIRPNAEQLALQWNTINTSFTNLIPFVGKDDSLTYDETIDAINNIKTLRATISSIFRFYNGYDPLFSWWMPKTFNQLDSTLQRYSKVFFDKSRTFVSGDKSGIVGQPIGKEALIHQLQYEMIPYTPEELIATAKKEFVWCQNEMLKAAKEMGYGTDWNAAVEKVKNSYVPPGEQPEAILDLYNESIDFVKKHDLISIPPLAEETWGMTMMSPELQRILPFFYGGEEISIAYPTNTMEEDQRLMSMRGNNPHFSRATVHHELIPGHNLEMFSNAHYRTYRNFQTPFWIEGWSLYWELLLWDQGFPQGPEDRIGMLFWHMHRCARILFSLNYHLKNWTPQQCIDFLVDNVAFERANAEGEVRRAFEGNYGPLYQIAYLTGGHQFDALKHELVDSKKMGIKQFHDSIMHLNAMPVEMVRAILTNQKLDMDFTTNWRFYNK